MKKILSVMVCASLSLGAMAQEALAFNANADVKSKMTVYDGTEVSYTAYERLFYVTNVEDSAYQFLNVYVPDGAPKAILDLKAAIRYLRHFDKQMPGNALLRRTALPSAMPSVRTCV